MVAKVGAKRYTTTSELLDAEDEGISQAIVDGITKYNQERAASYNQKVGVVDSTGRVWLCVQLHTPWCPALCRY